ncbi:MAG: conjugative transposon protein TraK [Bacilli bacterium]|nr:conjugative transposon protein TraK [Bacilli bacterium]
MKSLSNIENGVRTLRVVIYAVIVTNIITVGFAYFYTKSFCRLQDQKIYALRGETPLMIALNQNVKDNRQAEAKAQLEEFHRLFFAINPDLGETTYNMMKVLKMSDASVSSKYQQLNNNGYYKQIADANIRCQYRCDSILIDFNSYPYSAAVFGRTCINRPSGTTVRKLVTTCQLRNVSRTDDIPHGFFVENLQIIDNTDLEDKTIYETR